MSLTVVSNTREQWLSQLVTTGAIDTPALVIDVDEVNNALHYFKKYLPEARLHYATKANNTPSLLKHLAEGSVNFDVASVTEINELRALGIPASRMILSNPVKSPATVNAFFDQGLPFTVVDNPYDLEMLRQGALRIGNKKIKPGLFVRIRIPTTDVQIDLNQKFGTSEEEAVDLLGAVANAGFTARGIQFHVGTQSWNASNYKIGIAAALKVIDAAFEKYQVRCDSINIGGGFPDPFVAREAGGHDNFFAQLRETIRPALDRGLNIIAEPGRVLISGACSAVCTIVGKSIRNGTPWIYLDDGAYGLYSGKFFDHKEFHFKVLETKANISSAKLTPYVVAGPTCDSLDVICHTMLPQDLTPGDVLCSHNMGAYSLVTACHFNGFGQISSYVSSSSSELASLAEIADTKKEAANF